MKRLVAAIAATWSLLLAGPVLLGPAGAVVLGHSQLISSTPGSSEALAEAPTEIRLAFSEPIESAYTSLTILDAEGKTVASNLGDPDPADPFVLLAPLEALPEGGYAVSWQALSAADGHTTNGFFTFFIGEAMGGMPQMMTPDAMHEAPPAIADIDELAGRAIGYLGLLTAFGLVPIGWLVLRPAYGRLPRPLVIGQAVALAIAVSGGLLLAWAVSSHAELDFTAYLTGSRTGTLLAARIAVSAVGVVVVVGLLALGRPGAALLAGLIAATGGLVLLDIGGHAAAFVTPAPVAAMLVHLASAGIWLTGIIVLLVLAVKRERPAMTALIPRFSALAQLAIAFLAATGLYADWVQTRDPISVASDYQMTLAIKIAIVVVALVLGALNFFDAGRERPWLGGFRVRVGAEVLLAAAILIVTANLGSGFPPGGERPIPIGEVVSSAVIEGGSDVSLEVGPGRPGPNRYTVTVDPAPPEAAVVTIELARMNAILGESKIPLQRMEDDPTGTMYFTDGGLLPPDSSWEVTVAVTAEDGSELGHGRFAFAVDRSMIVEGREPLPIDPGFALGFLLLCAGVLAGVYALSGGSMPGVEHATGRIALASGGAVGSAIGLILVVFGKI